MVAPKVRNVDLRWKSKCWDWLKLATFSLPPQTILNYGEKMVWVKGIEGIGLKPIKKLSFAAVLCNSYMKGFLRNSQVLLTSVIVFDACVC